YEIILVFCSIARNILMTNLFLTLSKGVPWIRKGGLIRIEYRTILAVGILSSFCEMLANFDYETSSLVSLLINCKGSSICISIFSSGIWVVEFISLKC